jgi:methylmalonyl-CoA mutase
MQADAQQPAESLAAWRARVDKELAGTPFDKLRHRLLDGFEVEPLYVARPSEMRPEVARSARLVELFDLGEADLDLRDVELAGATAVDELGLALFRWAELAREGRVADTFRLAVGPDVLLQVGKLRALRLLIARLAELSQLTLAPTLHAVTSLRHFSRCDPWTNLLRNTASVFAAVVGGADRVTPMPWDICLGAPSEDALRLAAHTARLALEEAWLGAVADPAAGSFALEQLTAELCARGWAAFQDFERGVDASARITASAAQRAQRVARRQDGLIGVTLYPNLDESVPARDGAPPVPVSPRLAEPFEALRALPAGRVFLANIGPVAEHTARATWIRGFYEAGGIAAIANDGFEDPDACAEAYACSGAPFAVVCAADSAFPRLPAFITSLRERGAEVLVAGRPGAHEAALREAGAEGFIYVGVDVLAELRRVRARHFATSRTTERVS